MKKFLTVFCVLALGVSMAFAQGQSGTTLSAYVECNPHYTQTFHWTIDKSVTPDKWDLFTGDKGTSQYTITVTKDNGIVAAWIDGQVCVTNGGAVATENLQITATLTKPPASTVIASVTVDLSSNPILDPGEMGCYGYSLTIPAASVTPGASYKVTTNTTITNHSGHLGTPFGPPASCSDLLPSSPTLINNTINVDDSNGGSWPFSDDGSVSYDKSFTCDGDEGAHNNTATIRETGQFDDASVKVNCYALKTTKDASTSLTRTWTWTIDKSADQSSLTLATGEMFTVNYSVKVDATSTDSNWGVSGTISISNPAPISAKINSISDIVSNGIAATVTDNDGNTPSFPFTLPANSDTTFKYSASLPNADSRTNTATATLQNYSYDKDGKATISGTTDFSGTASVAFGAATINKVDDCIDASDTYEGSFGTVCYGDAPKTFPYSRKIGPYEACGTSTVDNTASFTTNTSGTTGSDSWTVNVNVPCLGGCTLTPGYWKTHSHHGPAPADDAWFLLGDVDADLSSEGADETFFTMKNTQSYYQVLWTSPSGGNAYYILAHAYIAAKLNILNGASSTTAVDAALTAATNLFNAYTPAQVAALKGNSAIRKQFIDLATTLDNYNNGLIGPGHCSEQSSVVPSVSPTQEKPAEQSLNKASVALPEAFALAQNYPNPFNPSTTFAFDLPQATQVKLTVYSITGQEVAVVVNSMLNAGHFSFTWQAPANTVSGVYLYKLETAEFTSVKKMIYQK